MAVHRQHQCGAGLNRFVPDLAALREKLSIVKQWEMQLLPLDGRRLGAALSYSVLT